MRTLRPWSLRSQSRRASLPSPAPAQHVRTDPVSSAEGPATAHNRGFSLLQEAAAAASKAAAAPPKATSGKGASGKGSSADDASSSGDDDEEEDEDADELVVELRRFAKRHSAKESAEKLAEMQTENLEHKMHILARAPQRQPPAIRCLSAYALCASRSVKRDVHHAAC